MTISATAMATIPRPHAEDAFAGQKQFSRRMSAPRFYDRPSAARAEILSASTGGTSGAGQRSGQDRRGSDESWTGVTIPIRCCRTARAELRLDRWFKRHFSGYLPMAGSRSCAAQPARCVLDVKRRRCRRSADSGPGHPGAAAAPAVRPSRRQAPQAGPRPRSTARG